jgi:flagellar hook-associated protein 2
LTAVKLGSSTITVQNDSAKIVSAAQAFVDSFNEVAKLIKSNSSYDASTKTSQALTGDSSTRSVLSTLGNARTTTPDTLSSAVFKTLGELGITIQQSGQLKLDESKLNKAISTSASDVVKTLSAYGKSIGTAVMTMQDTGGVVSNRINSLKSSVSHFTDSKEAMEKRVGLIEKRYRAQFTALDKYMSAMNETSTSLTQQLKALTGSSN